MHKILVIEDEPLIRGNIAEILELSGYAVSPVDNGTDGVLTAFEVKPDLILCDIMMPEMDGHTVLELLKGSSATDDIHLCFFDRSGRTM